MKHWRPSLGERYWWVNISNSCRVDWHDFKDDKYDKLYIDIDNVFRTEQEAQQVANKIRLLLKSKYRE